MNPEDLKSLIKVAKKHSVKAAESDRDMVDNFPAKDLAELFHDALLNTGKKHQRKSEDGAFQEQKDFHPEPICDDNGADTKCLIIPLKQATFISKYYHDTNFSDYDTLFVGRYCQPGNVFRTLLQFDLDCIPDNCTIIKAELNISLCANELPQCGAPIYLHPILTKWRADHVTWDHGPEVAREHWEAFIPGGVLGPICIDVIDYIEDYFECPNDGLMLRGHEKADGVLGIEARDCGPCQQGPFLLVEMECGDEE